MPSSDTGEGAMVQTFPTPGIHEGIDLSGYLQLDAASSSRLKNMGRSPAFCQHDINNPRPASDAMSVGTVVDSCLFTPNVHPVLRAGTCAGIIKKTGKVCGKTGSLRLGGSWYCKVRGHAPVEAGPPIKPVLSEADYDRALRIFHAIQAHPWWQEYEPTIAASQETVVWECPDTGILCKTRPDTRSETVLTELKVCRQAAPAALYIRKCVELWHAQQLAWQARGLAEHGVEVTERRVLAAHPMPPHEVTSYLLLPELNEWADKVVYDRALRYAECANTGHWPAGDLEADVPLPGWAEDGKIVTEDDDTVDTED